MKRKDDVSMLKFHETIQSKSEKVYKIHTIVDGDKVGALVGLDDGETDGDVEGLDVGVPVGEDVQSPLVEPLVESLHALVARLCVFFAISGASLSLFALPSTLSFLALPNRRSLRCDIDEHT